MERYHEKKSDGRKPHRRDLKHSGDAADMPSNGAARSPTDVFGRRNYQRFPVFRRVCLVRNFLGLVMSKLKRAWCTWSGPLLIFIAGADFERLSDGDTENYFGTQWLLALFVAVLLFEGLRRVHTLVSNIANS